MHHLEELLVVDDPVSARDRVTFLRSLPLVAWMQTPKDVGLGSIVDILSAEAVAHDAGHEGDRRYKGPRPSEAQTLRRCPSCPKADRQLSGGKAASPQAPSFGHWSGLTSDHDCHLGLQSSTCRNVLNTGTL
jgi:hypothetical protein